VTGAALIDDASSGAVCAPRQSADAGECVLPELLGLVGTGHQDQL
jgi:hypothetical protein